MAVTPSQLFALALSRHRQPLNWTLHFAALVLFCLMLLTHSYLLLAASLILLGTGFFPLELGDAPDNRWFRLVGEMVEWEKNWAAAPWNWYKWHRLLFVVCVMAATIWALWVREPASIGLLMGFAALAWVIRDNRNKDADSE